ncbi:MAG: 6-bladed beta-propeller [Tannerella sp.]|jgi:hypothetical protein|nr:6-bladed beta-propeller [Tannerella sp.]
MKQILLLLWAFILLIGCSPRNRDDKELKIIVVNPDDAQENINLSEISCGVRYVPLQTDDNCLIGEIDKVRLQNGFIYLSDNKTVFKFTDKGDFVSALNKKGQGPDEYTGITDFIADEAGNILILNNKKIRVYDPRGVMKKSIALPDGASTFVKDGDNILMYSGYIGYYDGLNENSYRLKTLDLNTETIVNKQLRMDDKKAKYLYVLDPANFSFSDKNIYLSEAYNDTVYQIIDGKAKPALYIDFAGNNIPAPFFNSEYSDIKDFTDNVEKYSYSRYSGMFMEGQNGYFIDFVKNRKLFFCYAYKDGKKATVFNGIKDDVSLHSFPIPLLGDWTMNILVSGDKLIILAQPLDIMEYARENLTPAQQKEVAEVIKFTSEDQNPVLLIVDF